MSNTYFEFTGPVLAGAVIRSDKYNSDMQAVETGFEKVFVDLNRTITLPDNYTGNVKLPTLVVNSLLRFTADGNMGFYSLDTFESQISSAVQSAASSAATATTQAGNASTSASQAASSASSASTSAANASASASQAANSATQAANSATQAANSATQAANSATQVATTLDVRLGTTGNLGTAATATVTTSSTDTTAGRLLKVGDFGIGAKDVPTVNTWPTNVGSYFVEALESLPNAPIGASGSYIVIVHRGNAITLMQNSTNNPIKIYTGIFSTYSGPSDPASWLEITKEGDFGIGGSTAPALSNADTILKSGLYSVPAEWVGSPVSGVDGANQGFLFHQPWSTTTYRKQDFLDINSGWRSMTRRMSNGVWSSWVMNYNQRNILGSVSHSGGIPTGAIIQRGSNANGEFVRFADGTQICTASFFTDHVTRVTTATHNWVFPVSFDVGQTTTSGSFWCVDAGIAFRNGVLTQSNNSPSPSSNAVEFSGFDFNKQPFSESLFVLTAIGRWF